MGSLLVPIPPRGICHDKRGVPDYEAILARAKTGDLKQQELDEVVAQFRSNLRSHPDRYRLVMTIGHATLRDPSGRTHGVRLGLEKARALIEPLLDNTDDAWLVREALTVLCSYLGDMGRHRERVRAWTRPVDWDEDGDVRVVAISCLGQLIAQEGTGDGLDDLLAIAENPGDLLQDWAVRGLALALGEKMVDLPTVRKGMRSDPLLVERITRSAREWRDSQARRKLG